MKKILEAILLSNCIIWFVVAFVYAAQGYTDIWFERLFLSTVCLGFLYVGKED